MKQVRQMTQIAVNYAKVLYELGIEPETIKETRRRYFMTKQLQKALTSPIISNKQKHGLIECIFDKSMHSFLKVLSDYRSMNLLPQILKAYWEIYWKEHGVLAATLTYVTKPSEEQVEQFFSYLKKRFHAKKVHLRMKQDPMLVGGFILKAGDLEMDWSLRGRFKRLEQKLTN